MVSDRIYELVDELDDLEESFLKNCNELRSLVKEFKGELP